MQDKMIQELQNKLQELKTSNRELSENFEYKELQLLENIAACDKARSELFNAQAKLNVFQRKEDEWLKCQSELENLKVKFVLQGELGKSQNFINLNAFIDIFLVVRQKDCLDSVRKAARDEEIRLIQLASSKEIEDLKARLLTKSQELTASKAKATELEEKTNKKGQQNLS